MRSSLFIFITWERAQIFNRPPAASRNVVGHLIIRTDRQMKIHCTLTFILISCFTFGQVDNKKVKEQAELTAKSLLQGDYETLLRFTYPKVIEMVGGRERMISLIKKGKVEMGQQGISFETVTIGEPSKTVKAGEEIHCLVPQTIFMKVPKGKMKSETHLLAVSKDNGNNWFFIDTVNLTMDNVKTVLPNYNSDLKIPTKKQPKFIAD